MSSHSGRDISLSESHVLTALDANGVPQDLTIDEKDIKALTLAISGIVEGIARKVIEDRLENLLPPLVEQSVKNMLPESVSPLIAAELPRLIIAQEAMIKESVEKATSQALPDLIEPVVERLAPGVLQSEIQKLLNTTGTAVIEKIAWEIVPAQAEIEVRKEIARLSADD
jgi:hypothetical protein